MSKKSKARRKREREERFKKSQVQELKKASEKKEKKKSSAITTFKPKKYIPCHNITEIYPNFYLCNINQVKQMVREYSIDVLVPLDHVDGYIWDLFDGEIHYWPISDMDILPTNILNRAVKDIITCLKKVKKVGMFCLGGHGRTGYLAACVLGKLNISDPIQHIHDNYCIKAIEVYSQYKHISEYLNNPELLKHYIPDEYDMMYGLYGFGYPRYTIDDWGFQTHFNSPAWAEVKAETKFGYVDSMVGDKDEFDEEVFEDPIKVNEFLLKEGVM